MSIEYREKIYSREDLISASSLYRVTFPCFLACKKICFVAQKHIINDDNFPRTLIYQPVHKMTADESGPACNQDRLPLIVGLMEVHPCICFWMVSAIEIAFRPPTRGRNTIITFPSAKIKKREMLT